MEQMLRNPFVLGIGAGLATYYVLETMKPAMLFKDDGTPAYEFLTPMTVGGLVAAATIYYMNMRQGSDYQSGLMSEAAFAQ